MSIRYYTLPLELRLSNRRVLKIADEARANVTDDDVDDEDEDEDEDDHADDDEEGRSVEGYAAVFNSDSEDLGGFVERISPTAFNRSLAPANGQIVMLWSHDPAQPIGSTRSGSLALSTDSKGLRFKLDASRLNAQQRAAVAAGEMQMSFGFTVKDDAWDQRDNGDYVRTLNDVNLIETSLVISPAYAGTSAGLRSSGQLEEAQDAFTAFKQTIETKYQSKRVELKIRSTEILATLIEQQIRNI